MPPKSQARRIGPVAAGLRASMLLAAASLLPACAGGLNLDRLGADRSIVTGSVTPASPWPAGSDESAISQSVLSWAADPAPDDAVPWINLDTGASGAIAKLADVTENGSLCRRFRASRENFDGKSAYTGEACRDEAGRWAVKALDPA